MFKSILVICSILFFSCNNSSSNSNPYGVIDCDNDSDINYTTCYHGILSGTVLDNHGAPLANHSILLGYNYNNDNARPSTSISVELSNNTELNIWIESKCGDMIKEITNDNFTAGSYEFTWDATDTEEKLIKPGQYIVTVTTGDDSNSQSILMLYDASFYSSLNYETDYNVHAITDDSGNFSIDIACEPFGLTFAQTNSAGLYLGDYEIPFEATFNIYNSLGHVYSTDFISIESGHIDLVVP